MPDHGVVHCRACKTYQVLTWHSSSQSDYFTCKRCSQKTRGHVVRDNDHNVLLVTDHNVLLPLLTAYHFLPLTAYH